MQSLANFSFYFFFKLRLDLISPHKQLNNNKPLIINNNKSITISNIKRGFLSRGNLNLLSELINFNKQILNEELGNSVKILE